MAANDGPGNREAAVAANPGAYGPKPAQPAVNPLLAALAQLIAQQPGAAGPMPAPVPGQTPPGPGTPLGPFRIPGFPWTIHFQPIAPDQQGVPAPNPGMGQRTTF